MMEIDFGALLLSLCLTLLLYCAYPLLSANKRDTEITKKKYFWKCYGINFLIWLGCFIFEELTYGRGSSGGAYILWTWVFESVGKNKLRERGLLIEGKSADTKKEKQKSAEQSPAKANTFSPQFTQTRSAATESYKEQFIRTVQEEYENTCGHTMPYGIAEEVYNIDQEFSLYGKSFGIIRLNHLGELFLTAYTTEEVIKFLEMYSYICGLMVPLGDLTKAESDQMSKAFAEKMQNVLLNILNT